MTSRCWLLDLPLEVRLIIYNFAFEGIHLSVVPLVDDWNFSRPKLRSAPPALLLTCKQISYEWKIPHRNVVLSIGKERYPGSWIHEETEKSVKQKLSSLGLRTLGVTTRLTMSYRATTVFARALNVLQLHPLQNVRRITILNVGFSQTMGNPDDGFVNDWVAAFPCLQRFDVVLKKHVWAHAKKIGLPNVDYFVAPLRGESTSINWFKCYGGMVLLDHFMPIDRSTRMTCVGVRRCKDGITGGGDTWKEEQFGNVTHVHVFYGGPNDLNDSRQEWKNKCPTSEEPPLNLMRPNNWDEALEYGPSQKVICSEHRSKVSFSKKYGMLEIMKYIEDYDYRVRLKRNQDAFVLPSLSC